MVTLIIGYGPNSIEVPCLLFPTRDSAVDFLKDVHAKYGGHIYLDKDPSYQPPNLVEQEFWDLFFTGHYDGRGGISIFGLKTLVSMF